MTNEKTRYIYRAQRNDENPYFQFRRATAQDRALTFEARGMLAYILSKPDHWKVQPSDLEQQCKKSVVYRVLGELIKHGYIDRQQERDAQKKIVAWHYLVHEEPLPRKQEVALPEVENQDLEKRDIRDKREEEKKEKKKKETKSASANKILFQAIGLGVFSVSEFKGLSPASLKRIGALEKVARQLVTSRCPEADDTYIADMVMKFSNTEKFKPAIQGNSGFELKFAAYLQTQTPPPALLAPPSPQEAAPQLTPEQKAARHAEYERIMKEMTDAIVMPTVRVA